MNTALTELPPRATPMPRLTAATPDTILLVDDHELVRLGFRALVLAQVAAPGEPPLATLSAATLAEALAVYATHCSAIAVVVLDLALPDARGLGGLMRFRQAFPEAAVVVLSGTASLAMAHEALALGALAFFPKSGDLGEMLGFVHTCVREGPLAAKSQRQLRAPALTRLSGSGAELPVADASGQLTTRQLQILQQVLEGKSNREIGEALHLSEGTIKNHLSMLLLSFAVRSRAQLISKLRG